MQMQFLILICCMTLITNSQQIANLNNFIGIFRKIRLSSTRILEKSTTIGEHRRNLKENEKIQQVFKDIPFPCSLNNTRSKNKPTSVHKLKPGDIDVVGGIGDSLTAGFGSNALNPLQIFIESRGKSWSIGGQGTWRNTLTLPNILKEFNPNLIGYSLRDSLSIERASQFNVAEGGAVSFQTPYMSKILVKRIKNDPRVDIENDWKMVTHLIGDNDFCLEMCYYRNTEDIITKHKEDLLTVLRILRDNLPRTIVNIVPPPHLEILLNFTNKPLRCDLLNKLECPCFFNEPYIKNRKQYYDVITKWQQVDIEVANYNEFDLEDFTVVVQPFSLNYKFPVTKEGFTDYSYMSADCFHFSQKGNARVANSLWNNMLEPVGQKSTDGIDILTKFNCPTAENPYIFTKRNSFNRF